MNRTILHIMMFVAGAVVTINTASAQSIDRMRSLLGSNSGSGASVTVVEDSNAKAAIEAVDGKDKPTETKGFRVVLYYDDVQYAQDKAKKIQESFKKDFPEINSYLLYEKPYFKVSVGDCLNYEEALMLRSKLLEKYPNAFIRRDNIEFETLMDVRRRVDCLKLDPDVREKLLHSRALRDEMRKDETLYIVMQRDAELNKLLTLDDLSREQAENNNHTEQDPGWINEW